MADHVSIEADSVGTTSVLYNGMADDWGLIRALLGGTESMRAAGERWLPKETSEEPGKYSVRLARSFLYGALKDTIKNLVSKPFSRAVAIQGELEGALANMVGDVDGTGRDVTQFAREWFESGVTYGLSHMLVDFPAVSGTLTLEEERSLGKRPVWIHVPATDLIGWRSEADPTGSGRRLTQIRFRETRTEPLGEYGDHEVEYVRVYGVKEWSLWRRRKKSKEFEKAGGGEHTFNRVPLVTLYLERTGFMTASPPLGDLAWLNLAHWQGDSDQRNLLRFARASLLLATGFTKNELKSVKVGPAALIRSTNAEAKLAYVEHTGKAIGAGAEDLVRLEARMEVLGLQPLMKSAGKETATAKMLGEARTHSGIQAWIRALENALKQAWAISAEWAKTELPDDFGVDVFNDFAASVLGDLSIANLLKMRTLRELTAETFLREMKRRGVLSDGVSVEDEIEQLAGEVPLGGGVTGDGDGGGGDGEEG